MTITKKLLVALCLPIIGLSVALPVLAETESSDSSDSQQSEAAKKEAEAQQEAAKQEFEQKREAAKQAAEKLREAQKNDAESLKELLSGDRLKNCQDNEDEINNTISTIAQRDQQKLNLFTKIAERTEAFYQSKGKTLSNYDELLAAVNAKQSAAQTAIDNAIASGVVFKCDGNDPKGTANAFKTQVKAMNSALKDYRTAVKNLIVGVKSVQSTTEPEANQ